MVSLVMVGITIAVSALATWAGKAEARAAEVAIRNRIAI